MTLGSARPGRFCLKPKCAPTILTILGGAGSETWHSYGGPAMNDDEHVAPHPAVVKTAKRSSGRLLDWIPIESQVAGGKIATPPPSLPTYRSASVATTSEGPRFELDDPALERGPQGTVPVLRDLSSHRDRVQRRRADKKGPRRHPTMKVRGMDLNSIPDPDPFGYYHPQSCQSGPSSPAPTPIPLSTP